MKKKIIKIVLIGIAVFFLPFIIVYTIEYFSPNYIHTS